MNVLSLGAALGVTVWIFEDAHLETLLRFTSTGAIENTIPLLVIAFGFGLSMDYEVFLLSRIVELHEQGHDTRTAVTLGLQRSGRIITSAALLMVIVFAGFATGDLLILKQMGVALVLAITIDATLVRMLLVPATMSVLGSVNWWAPAPLRRLHADGESPSERHPHAGQPAPGARPGRTPPRPHPRHRPRVPCARVRREVGDRVDRRVPPPLGPRHPRIRRDRNGVRAVHPARRRRGAGVGHRWRQPPPERAPRHHGRRAGTARPRHARRGLGLAVDDGGAGGGRR